jgi:hypothetical protein
MTYLLGLVVGFAFGALTGTLVALQILFMLLTGVDDT